ncbi:MAG: hypothetical protein ACTHJV_10480 [Rhizobiaceae bacterium]
MPKTPADSAKDEKKSPAARSLEREQRSQRNKDEELDRGLKDTFPASDPVSPTGSTTSGAPREKKR